MADENELTAEKVFQLLLEEVLRDQNITDVERSTVQEVKEALGIDSEAHQRAYKAALEGLRARGKQADYELVPEDVMRRVAARACADGKISVSELEILKKVSNALKVDPDEHRVIFKAIEETARRS